MTAATTAATDGAPVTEFDMEAIAAALASSDKDPTDLAAEVPAAPDIWWATSVFADLDAAVATMSKNPDPVGLNCAPWADLGLPARFVTVAELRAWFIRHRSPRAVEAVWRDLVARARTDRQWASVAAGMMVPALAKAAAHLARGFQDDPRDIEAEMLAAFLGALQTLDLQDRRLFWQLRWSAVRAGIAVRYAHLPHILVGDIENAVGMAPHLPYGHPDLIVARAVRTQVISAEDAELILATRLEQITVERYAAMLGQEYGALRMRRTRAESALVAAITDGTLSGAISAESCAALDRRAARRSKPRIAALA